MATRRARFKPVLNQPARRGRSGATDGQTAECAKEAVVTLDQLDKITSPTPNHKTPNSTSKPEKLSNLSIKNSPSDEKVKTTSEVPTVLKSVQPSNASDPSAKESPEEVHPVKESSQQRRTSVALSSKQEATPAAPAELPTRLPRPATPVSGSPDGKVLAVSESPGDASSVSKNDASSVSKSDAKSDAGTRSTKDDRKETAPSVRQRRQPSSTNQRALAARRNFMKLAKDGPPARSSLTMFDLIFYNPTSNPMTNKSTPPAKSRDRQASICSVGTVQEHRLEEEKVDDVDDNQIKESEDKENKEEAEEEIAVPVPRVKVGPDGRIVIDEQSLVIETTESKKTRAEMEKSEVVFDTGASNGFYKRTKRSKDWSNRETLKFYRALHVYGTDFSLMQVLFKDRTRKELKLKFKKEERMRIHLIDKALCSPLDFDTTELEKEAQEEEEEEAARLAKEKEEKEKPKPKPKPVKTIRRPCSLAQKEMLGEDAAASSSETVPLPKKKKVRKPRAKPVPQDKDEKDDLPKGLDFFDDVVLPTNPAPSTSSNSKKVAKAPASRKRKASPRDPNQPSKKKHQKKAKVVHVISPESDHSYAAKQSPSPACTPLTNGTPVAKTPSRKASVTPARCHNNNVEVESPEVITIDVSNHLFLTPTSTLTRTVAVTPNEFASSQFATVRTPKTPVRWNITPSAGSPTEFGSPRGPAPNKAVPVPLPVHPSGPPSSGPGVILQQPLSQVEPGSFYLLKTQCPDNPKRHVLGVYMVTNNQTKVSSPLGEAKILVHSGAQAQPAGFLSQCVTPLSPAATPLSRAATPLSPAATPLSPAATPLSPAATPLSPAATPLSPAATPFSPAATPFSPAVNPLSPAMTLSSPVITPSSPPKTMNDSVEKIVLTKL